LAYSAKYPLLLYAKDPLTTVLARQIHLDLRHARGPGAITTELNNKFWVPRLSTLFRKIAYSRIPCRKRQAKPTKQIMAPLTFFCQPSARLHPFDFTAVDIAGPFKTKVGRSEVKRWQLIFGCSTVGAVHFEMIDTMDTSSFLLAVEQFLAVRPRPSAIIADNGTNFTGGGAALQEGRTPGR
jgi:hypothetical protein